MNHITMEKSAFFLDNYLVCVCFFFSFLFLTCTDYISLSDPNFAQETSCRASKLKVSKAFYHS